MTRKRNPKTTKNHKNTIKKVQALMITTVLLSGLATAWHSQGHLLVAEIAKQHLQTTQLGKEALAWTTSVIRPFSQFCGEKMYPFVEAATWPDKIKELEWNTMDNWHFYDRPVFRPPTYKPPKPLKEVSQNIIFVLNKAYRHLSSKKTPKDMKYGKAGSVMPKSIDFRFLIHFVGDIHQPLHCSAMYSERFPEGDMGGNLFLIKNYGDKNRYTNNLHYIWDDLMQQGAEVFPPLSQAQYQNITSFASRLISNHSYDDYRKKVETNTTFMDWAMESHRYVTDFVYEGIKFGEMLPDWYLAKGRTIVNERLILAGYRLANLIVNIYENAKQDDTLQKLNMQYKDDIDLGTESRAHKLNRLREKMFEAIEKAERKKKHKMVKEFLVNEFGEFMSLKKNSKEKTVVLSRRRGLLKDLKNLKKAQKEVLRGGDEVEVVDRETGYEVQGNE